METRRLTGTLTRNNRPIETGLQALGFDGVTLQQAVSWGNKLAADAQRFSVGRFNHDRPKLTQKEADRAFKIALARLMEGREL